MHRGAPPRIQGPWNKIALLRNLTELYTSAAAEWILWVDNDTLFGMMDRIIPFMRYRNKDLVVWANYPTEITEKFDANGTRGHGFLTGFDPRNHRAKHGGAAHPQHRVEPTLAGAVGRAWRRVAL